VRGVRSDVPPSLVKRRQVAKADPSPQQGRSESAASRADNSPADSTFCTY